MKRPNIKTNELLREADRGKPAEVQSMVQGLVSARRVSIDDALNQLESNKAACDQALNTRDFSVLKGAFVHFRKTLSLACASYAQPTPDFAGNAIQDITNMSKPFLNLSFTLIPDLLGGVAVFSWLPDANAACRSFVQSFMALEDARKSDALVQYGFDSFENFAAEPGWWEGLSEDAEDGLKIEFAERYGHRLWIRWCCVDSEPDNAFRRLGGRFDGMVLMNARVTRFQARR